MTSMPELVCNNPLYETSGAALPARRNGFIVAANGCTGAAHT